MQFFVFSAVYSLQCKCFYLLCLVFQIGDICQSYCMDMNSLHLIWMLAYQSWMELNSRIHSGKSIVVENQWIIRNEVGHWKDVLKRFMYVNEFLDSQNLAFRGQKDALFDRSNGNFLKLTEFISKFDWVLLGHVRRIKNKETHGHYLGKRIQNKISNILTSGIKDRINGIV